MDFVCTDVSAVDAALDWRSFDVVFLAALVGMSQEGKVDILRALAPKLRKGAVLVCRSAWGVRRVLYPVGLHFVWFTMAGRIGHVNRN